MNKAIVKMFLVVFIAIFVTDFCYVIRGSSQDKDTANRNNIDQKLKNKIINIKLGLINTLTQKSFLIKNAVSMIISFITWKLSYSINVDWTIYERALMC